MRDLRKEQERGALTMEASFVFPIMLLIILLMMVLGNAYYQKCRMDQIFNEAAIDGAAYCADPQLVKVEGGDIDTDSVLRVSANGGSGLGEVYDPTPLKEAAESGSEAAHGGSLTEFERLCDDAVSAYLEKAQLVPFGEAPLVGYLAARETEYLNLRILLLGRGAGLPAHVIRSRLRAAYV